MQMTTEPVVPLRFVDFAIRAWREGPYVQVIAHSTPAGGMRQPVAVRIGAFTADDYRVPVDAPLHDGADLGRRLARVLLPADVWRLLCESLRIIAPQTNLGLRLRLCLDDDLIDLPWEYLYRPDVDAPAAHGGFLLLDGHVSLVREPPSVVSITGESDRTQRGVFVGAMFDNGSDSFLVRAEHRALTSAMRPIKNLLALDFVQADDAATIDEALRAGCDVFHYAGHVDIIDGHGKLVQLVRAAGLREFDESGVFAGLEAMPERSSWASVDQLAPRLARAGVKLAVFNACNSGLWPFVRPLMRAGLPAVVGVQGLVSNLAALNFAEKLYQSLGVGLSLDEALTFARLYVMTPPRAAYDCDWARFMAYLPSETAVLFPRSAKRNMRERQQAMREERAETIAGVSQRLDGEGVSRMLSEIAASTVLILGRFTDKRKHVLDAMRTALATPPRQYAPLLFDFDKPGDRDLIESIVRFASVSRFVIADLSDPKSVPAELQAIVPQFPSLPVVTIIEGTQREYPVADNILRRQSVLHDVVHYEDVQHLLSILDDRVLAPAERLYGELRPRPLS